MLMHKIYNMKCRKKMPSSNNIQCHWHYNAIMHMQWWSYKLHFLQLNPSLLGVQ